MIRSAHAKKAKRIRILKKIGERLGEWVHSIGIAKDVQPSHAWRHLFKSVGRYAQIPEDVLDALQGHQPRGEGAKYGSHWPQMSYRWIKQIPRYEWDVCPPDRQRGDPRSPIRRKSCLPAGRHRLACTYRE